MKKKLLARDKFMPELHLTGVDKLDIDKLVPVPNDLAKLSNVVKNEVVKKTEYNTLVTKVGTVDTTGLVLKTKFDTDTGEINKTRKQGSGEVNDIDLDAVKNKIPNISGFLLTSVFNSKITEVENKIPDIKNLTSKTKLTAVENKIPNFSNLVLKTIYSTKIETKN